MSYRYEPRRPAILDLIMVVSFFLSAVDVCGFFCCLGGGLGIATLSWLGGPWAGLVGTFVGAVIVLGSLFRSLLSILLFYAAWDTWKGDPNGRSLHLTWAWLTFIIDVLDLLLTWGLNPATWWGLVYAVCLLYVMNQPDVVAYFDRYALGPQPPKPSGLSDDLL